MAFIARIGKTQGIRFSSSPPRKAEASACHSGRPRRRRLRQAADRRGHGIGAAHPGGIGQHDHAARALAGGAGALAPG